ncbi:MAG: hypothetical protein ACRDBI_14675, partial [Shewanella sp.]
MNIGGGINGGVRSDKMMASQTAIVTAGNIVDDFIKLYQELTKDDLPRLAEVYADNIVFID